MSEKIIAALFNLLDDLDKYKKQMDDANTSCRGGRDYYLLKSKYDNECKRLHEALRAAIKIIKEK